VGKSCCKKQHSIKSGITAGDVEFERAANDLIIRIKDSGDTVRIVDWLTHPDRLHCSF
jgi:hypothetical protein